MPSLSTRSHAFGRRQVRQTLQLTSKRSSFSAIGLLSTEVLERKKEKKKERKKEGEGKEILSHLKTCLPERAAL